MSGERFQSGPRTGETSGARNDDGRFLGCLTEPAIQGLADGSIRGPERMLAEQHVAECPRCSTELEAFSLLAKRLGELRDPVLPPGFTAAVLAAVEMREQVRDARHRALLSALPAALIAIGVLIAWAFAIHPAQRVRDLVVGATIGQRIAEATFSVLQAARLPLGLGALFVLLGIGALLVRSVSKMRAPKAARF